MISGCPSAGASATGPPCSGPGSCRGAVHKKHAHRHCEEIYFVISGRGLAGAGDDRVEVRAGDFHYIPAGVEHWLHNLSGADPIEVVGIYVNAASVEATGYTYLGDVTEADLAAARA